MLIANISNNFNMSTIFPLTGALGLIITLGGNCPRRLGVPGPPALGDPPPIALNRSAPPVF